MDKTDYIVFLIFIACIFMSGFGSGVLYGNDHIEKQAIEHGYAQHNPTTGEWEWREETKRNEPNRED